jgi:hypothetical protein
MKSLATFFGLLAILSLACAIQGAAPAQNPDQSNVATIVAATLQAMVTPTVAQPPTSAPPTETSLPAVSGKAVTAGNLSFVVPNELAAGANGVQIPAADEQNSAPWDVAPAHIEITLDRYVFQRGSFTAKIFVYPAQEYASAHAGAAENIKRLQAILANPASATKDNLPSVPFYNAAQMFASQMNIIKFQGGAGVRIVTAYSQAPGPVTNDMTLYHFQGLTSDNKYYIIAILPVQSPSESVQFPGYDAQPANLEAYYSQVAATLNSAAPESFNPNLTTLDALIQSIQVTP